MSLKASILAAASIAIVSGWSAFTAAQGIGGYEIKAFEDIEFAPIQEGSPLEIAVLWGDMATGPVGFLLKIPAGLENPMHSHTSDYRAIILDGQALHWIEGEDMNAVDPVGDGGYWHQPGIQVHGDANPSDGTTLALLIFDGPFDFILAE